AGANGAVRGDPCPRVVVGLTARVVQLDARVGAVDLERGAERRVRAGDVLWEEAPVTADAESAATGEPTELALVDGEVPSVGAFVALEAGGDVLVRDEHRTGVAAALGVGHERTAPTHVIDVTVRVHDARHAFVGPPAHRFDARGAGRRP